MSVIRSRGFGSLVVLSFAFFATSCAAPYQPDGVGGGYSDSRVGSDMVSVQFQGTRYNTQHQLEMYLLYRCAELTRADGYDYFIALNPYTRGNQINVITQVSFNMDAGGDSYFPTNTIGFSEKYQAFTLIKMGLGKRPAGNTAAFSARDVIEYLGPRIHESAEDIQGGVQNNIAPTQNDPTVGLNTTPRSYKNVYTGTLDLDHDPDNP